MGSRSWSTPAPTAITVKRHSGVTSVRRSATTRSSSEASTSPSRAGLSCGSDTLGPGGSELEYDPHGNILRWSAEHDGYEALDPLPHTGGRFHWTKLGDGSRSSTRSPTRAPGRSGWPSTSARRSRAGSMRIAPGPAGPLEMAPNWTTQTDGQTVFCALELPGDLLLVSPPWRVGTRRSVGTPQASGRIEPTTVVMGERAARQGKWSFTPPSNSTSGPERPARLRGSVVRVTTLRAPCSPPLRTGLLASLS